MAVVYDVIVTSSIIHFSIIKCCGKRETLGLYQHASLAMESDQNCMKHQSDNS